MPSTTDHHLITRTTLPTDHNELAELEDLAELRAHGVLEVLGLGLGELAGAEVEHLLGEQRQDVHVVVAERLVRLARAHDVRDEGVPVPWPLPLQDLTQPGRGGGVEFMRDATGTSACAEYMQYLFIHIYVLVAQCMTAIHRSAAEMDKSK